MADTCLFKSVLWRKRRNGRVKKRWKAAETVTAEHRCRYLPFKVSTLAEKAERQGKKAVGSGRNSDGGAPLQVPAFLSQYFGGKGGTAG